MLEGIDDADRIVLSRCLERMRTNLSRKGEGVQRTAGADGEPTQHG
jgi:hypothetical protein